jgi:molybdenum ABC transporter molybdate-binding protein
MPRSTAPVHVFAAGSLRAAFTQIAADYQTRTNQSVSLEFGAAGLLRERIEQGAVPHLFASADLNNPQRLADRGGWQMPQVFARNRLCALTAAHIQATPATLLATLLRADVRVGTSTPGADPSGDYVWTMFRTAEALRPGAYAVLDAKALKLTGAADSPRPPTSSGRGTYAWIMEQEQADVFLTYQTVAAAVLQELPQLRIVQLPPELQVSVSYGLTRRDDMAQEAEAFAAYLLSAEGQAPLSRLGFEQP